MPEVKTKAPSSAKLSAVMATCTEIILEKSFYQDNLEDVKVLARNSAVRMLSTAFAFLGWCWVMEQVVTAG